ncbi:enkurin domain-containing protein 1 isoform X2 [Parasteatoda tepidariorum]|nr:enkurin domain-containing protein 1 [Parasteatoda tepidariorum]XP_015922346.1 enkurin domain-containing protein 1 [Parasteatoda tepidariorum]
MEYELPQRPHTVGSVPKWHNQSDSLTKLLQEIHKEARGPVEKPKPPQKNYLKENLKRLKEIQACAKKKLEEKQTLEPLRVPHRYYQAQKNFLDDPSIKENMTYRNVVPPKTAGPFRRNPPSSPCLSSKSEIHEKLQTSKSLPRLNQIEESERIIKSRESNLWGTRKPISFSNTSKEIELKPKVRHQMGQIPQYLTKRKKEWEIERERQQKILEDSSIPTGYTLLPDDERVETLELLKKNQEELIRILAALPVRNDTMRLRNQKEELERQLAKAEEGIKIFSRPKVLIKSDS